MSRFIYMQDALPPCNSEFMRGLAVELMHRKEYWHWARRPLEQIWSECDDAYLCYRELPMSEGMTWVDRSDFGPTDLFDNVNQLAYTLSLAILPKDESWLTMSMLSGEDAQIVKQIQSQQIWVHRKAQTRRVFARHLKQLIVRGTSALFWHWDVIERYRRLSKLESIVEVAKAQGVPPDQVKLFGKARQVDELFNGPRIRVVDDYDLFLDPEADIVLDRRPGYIVQTYRRQSELMAEVDENSVNVYDKNLVKNMVPWRAEELYHMDSDSERRLQSLNTTGIYPQNSSDRGTLLIPVYIFYCPYMEHNGQEFYDTYFHVGISKEGNTPQMLRVEENPSDAGHRFMLTDNYIDWFTNFAYGISGIEKQLSAYKQLATIEAILLQAMIASQFPAYIMQDGILKENEGLNTAPGAINQIALGALGENFIRPIPSPERGVELGMQDNRWYKQKLAEGFGNLGSYLNDPNASVSSRETATSVNFKATTGSRSVDDQSEKFGDTLQELCQGVFDMSRQMADPTNGFIQYDRITGQPRQVLRESIRIEDFMKERDVQVLGLHGVVNRAQEVQELQSALEVVGMVAQALPNAPVLAQSIALQLISKLQVEVPKEATISPEQLAAANPQVQMMALQQAMPQVAQILQKLQMEHAPMPPLAQGAQAAGAAHRNMTGGVMNGRQPRRPQAPGGAAGAPTKQGLR